MKRTYFDNYEKAWSLLKEIKITPLKDTTSIYTPSNLERVDEVLAIKLSRGLNEPIVFQNTIGDYLSKNDERGVSKSKMRLALDGLDNFHHKSKKNNIWSKISLAWKRWRLNNFKIDILEMEECWKRQLRDMQIIKESCLLFLEEIVQYKENIFQIAQRQEDEAILEELLFLHKQMTVHFIAIENMIKRVDVKINILSQFIENCTKMRRLSN